MPLPEPSAPAGAPEPGIAPETAAAHAPAALDAHRMDALAFLAGGISHDLANPLGAILAFASFLASDPRLPADLRDDARLLRIEADRTNRLVRTLLEFARNRPAATTAVSVDSVLAEVLELESYVLAEVDVDREIPGDLPPVQTDPSRLRHLLLVVSVEAIRRLGDRRATGRLRVAAQADARDGMTITFAFERTPGREPVVGGAIPAAAALASALGGTLLEETTTDGGAFVLALPGAVHATPQADARTREGLLSAPGPVAAGADPTPRATPVAVNTPVATATPGEPLTILICDDEDVIRGLLARILDRGGFRTLEAASGAEALRVLESGVVDVVLTDHRMSAMSGIELFDRATEAQPHLRTRFVVMTGEPGDEELTRFADRNGVPILAKPFAMAEVEATIRGVTAS